MLGQTIAILLLFYRVRGPHAIGLGGVVLAIVGAGIALNSLRAIAGGEGQYDAESRRRMGVINPVLVAVGAAVAVAGLGMIVWFLRYAGFISAS
jgi:hypothetical protein